MLKKVISGGQIGADIAGLRAAHVCGLATGGYMPRGFRTKSGSLSASEVAKFGLREHSSDKYPPRTETNVVISDGTVRLAYNFASPGERLTKKLCIKYGKPYFDVSLAYYDGWHIDDEGLSDWLEAKQIEVLNVAGNADIWIERPVEQFLVEVFKTALHVTELEL